MQRYNIHGMTVGITAGGKRYIFNYGVASTQTKQPVDDETLFELGSISKTFTATLASYAQVLGKLSLSDPVSAHLPALRGTKFGNVSLLALGTHTPGGLPLQVPDRVHNDDDLMLYLSKWHPAYTPETYRTYNNISIGMLGVITAKSMNETFEALMDQDLLPALGLSHTHVNIPATQESHYAQGYRQNGSPVRMTRGVLSSEAYGLVSTAGDLLRFLEENMNEIALPEPLRRAIQATHTGYFKAGIMTQDLIWEQYKYPVTLGALHAGNSTTMLLDATPVAAIRPPQRPRNDAWINKTGSTNGFGEYVAFVPEKQLGIVILANRNYPIDARVSAAYKILTSFTAL
jgi:beta-lactamase class C